MDNQDTTANVENENILPSSSGASTTAENDANHPSTVGDGDHTPTPPPGPLTSLMIKLKDTLRKNSRPEDTIESIEVFYPISERERDEMNSFHLPTKRRIHGMPGFNTTLIMLWPMPGQYVHCGT